VRTGSAACPRARGGGSGARQHCTRTRWPTREERNTCAGFSKASALGAPFAVNSPPAPRAPPRKKKRERLCQACGNGGTHLLPSVGNGNVLLLVVAAGKGAAAKRRDAGCASREHFRSLALARRSAAASALCVLNVARNTQKKAGGVKRPGSHLPTFKVPPTRTERHQCTPR